MSEQTDGQVQGGSPDGAAPSAPRKKFEGLSISNSTRKAAVPRTVIVKFGFSKTTKASQAVSQLTKWIKEAEAHAEFGPKITKDTFIKGTLYLENEVAE